MKNSKLFRLNWLDVLKAGVLSAISAGSTALLQVLDGGQVPGLSGLRSAGTVALIAFLSYLLKNFLSNSDGHPVKPESTTSNPEA